MKETLPSRQTLDRLAAESSQVYITIYIPLDYKSPESITANEIRLKNTTKKADKLLKAHKPRLKADKDTILEPLRRLIEQNQQLWHRQWRSMVILISDTQLRYYFLPLSLKDEKILLGNHYYLSRLYRIKPAN